MPDTLFNRRALKPLSEAEQVLKGWSIKYEKKPDGHLFVPGHLYLSYKGLTRLPDLAAVSVGGNFYCAYNQLTSLEGAPHTVGGGFSCSDNRLISLEHAPHTVGGDFSCAHNRLISLEHAPHTVRGDLSCAYNQLTSLAGVPQTFNGDFYYCHRNQLTSLEHAPQTFKKLNSDFGEFYSWDAVPENLRGSPSAKPPPVKRSRGFNLYQAAEKPTSATIFRCFQPIAFDLFAFVIAASSGVFLFPDGLRRCGQQLGQADEVVGAECKIKSRIDSGCSAECRFGHAYRRLDPAEDFFDAFADHLADGVSRVAQRPAIDGGFAGIAGFGGMAVNRNCGVTLFCCSSSTKLSTSKPLE